MAPSYADRDRSNHHFSACLIARTRVPVVPAVLAAACSKRQQHAAVGYQLAAARSCWRRAASS